jgi:limonene-1,2-epoxide hydrolase
VVEGSQHFVHGRSWHRRGGRVAEHTRRSHWRYAKAKALARRCNEFAAELLRARPDRFASFACLPLPDIDASLNELAYVFEVLELDGVVLFTNVNGVYLGDSVLEPVFEELERRRGVVQIDRRRSQMESPIEVVRRFCAAWSDNIGAAELAAFFTDDAVYHNIPLAPVTGREAIAKTIASFIRPGAPGIESIEFRVMNIAANGPVVMTERVDVFRLPGKSFELQVMGTFEVHDGKINAWRDYFDQNQFTIRMGG